MSHKEQKDMKYRKKFSDQKDSASPQRLIEVLKYPPINQAQFRSTTIDFILSEHFDHPVSANELFQHITDCFKIKTNTPFLRNLQIQPILKQLANEQSITLQTLPVGIQMQDFILQINSQKLRQLNIQYSKDRPRKMPSYEEWIDQENKSLHQGMVEKIGSLLEDGTNTTGQQNLGLLPRIAAQKQKCMDEVLGKQSQQQQQHKSIGQVKLMYEDNMIEMAINRRKLAMMKNGNSIEEEEVRRKFQERGIQICEYGTRDKCNQSKGTTNNCTKTHFKRIFKTFPSASNQKATLCQNLDQCPNQDTCTNIHYFLEYSGLEFQRKQVKVSSQRNYPAQWINCDLRVFDFRVLGKFDVVMADPPWDIHMNLPYGTLKDKEMKALRVDLLQDDGVIFLWVTGRAMELGRECLQLWGYRRVEELVWIKINNQTRIIRSGRTGHWLNHSKEHCLVGIKGNPNIVRALDCDTIVSEVRETSRKPDEIYGLIERMSPNGKKVELFGRPHNCRENWITLGNQLPDVYLEDEDIIKRFLKSKYIYNDYAKRFQNAFPQVDLSQKKMSYNLALMKNEENISVIYNNHIGLTNRKYQPPSLPGLELSNQYSQQNENIQ